MAWKVGRGPLLKNFGCLLDCAVFTSDPSCPSSFSFSTAHQQVADWWRAHEGRAALVGKPTAAGSEAAAQAAEVAPSEAEVEEEEESGSGNSRAAGWSPPVMSESRANAIMALLWSNMDEPLAQTLRQVGTTVFI